MSMKDEGTEKISDFRQGGEGLHYNVENNGEKNQVFAQRTHNTLKQERN